MRSPSSFCDSSIVYLQWVELFSRGVSVSMKVYGRANLSVKILSCAFFG